MSFSFDKVTTGTYNFVSVIWNSNPVGGIFATVISATAQYFVQVRVNNTSQLISRIFKFLQKLLKCFSGIAISVSFLPILFAS